MSGCYLGPRDALEMRLTQVWENTLGVQPIGVNDNFFDLGGNSLLAVRLIAQVRRDFGEDVPINALLQSATIEELACSLRRRGRYESQSSLVEIRTSGSRPPLFFVHPIGGSVFCYVNLSKGLGRISRCMVYRRRACTESGNRLTGSKTSPRIT